MRASKGPKGFSKTYLASLASPPLALESSYLCGLESWNSRVGEYKDREDRRKENVQTACGGHRENREMKGVDWGLGKAPSREQRQGED